MAFILPWRRRTHSVDEELLGLIRERLSLPASEAADKAGAVFEPASAEAIEEAEESLDFALPKLLKDVLREVGNGGVGPGHGLLGVRGGATDEHGNSLVDLYDGLSATNPDDPGWSWPKQLLPICPWGDATYSCIDCSTAEGRLVTYDANGYVPGADLARQLDRLDLTLDGWLRAWAAGQDLWSEMFPLE